MFSMLRNRFLFSHLYLEQFCQDDEHQAGAADLIADLQDWLPDWDDSFLFQGPPLRRRGRPRAPGRTII